MQYAVCSGQSEVCSVQYAVSSMLSEVGSVQYAVGNLKYAVCSMQYAVVWLVMVEEGGAGVDRILGPNR